MACNPHFRVYHTINALKKALIAGYIAIIARETMDVGTLAHNRRL